MTQHARVLVVDHDGRDNVMLANRLQALGCCVRTILPSESDQIDGWRPDMIFLRALQSAEEATNMARARAANDSLTRPPTVLITKAPYKDNPWNGSHPGIDLFLSCPFHDIELAARVRTLMRFRTMQIELERRAEMRCRYGLSTKNSANFDQVDASLPRVLAAGHFNESESDLAAILGADGQRFKKVTDPQDASTLLTRGKFDAVVMGVNGATSPWLTLCADIRHNPRLFNLPVVMVADQDVLGDPVVPYETGVNDILLRPINHGELRHRLDMLVRLDRYRRNVHEAYRKARISETSDSLTGLFSFGYLHDYLASLVTEAAEWNRSLTVGFFDVKGMLGINRQHSYAGGDRLLRQIGALISRLIRGEDLSVRYSGEEFVVVMPDTPREPAETALRRIANVVNHTEFALPHIVRPGEHSATTWLRHL